MTMDNQSKQSVLTSRQYLIERFLLVSTSKKEFVMIHAGISKHFRCQLYREAVFMYLYWQKYIC